MAIASVMTIAGDPLGRGSFGRADHSDRDEWFDSELVNTDPHYQPPLPRRATRARPGSREKVEMMAERLEKHRHIHHPDDFTIHRPLNDWQAIRMADAIDREANELADQLEEREAVA